jgi:HD superfamily phosphohydrolase
MGVKLFKDPVYGYIEVPDSIVSFFIDSAAFQRLRNVIQTSYTPLFSASLHNRFIHSIGVYHLGKLAYKSLKYFVVNNESLTKKADTLFNDCRYEELFLAACLLHDIGHAPFSHIGEEFYLNIYDREGRDIYEQLYAIVDSNIFKNDSQGNKIKKAAPHEVMSVIVSIRTFYEYFKDKDKEFFARCILGYEYTDHEKPENELKNCLISVLNSSLIDVDKLDYIIRDSFVSGYQNVSIDYIRLLQGFVIIENDKRKYLAYNKSAMSIIENVIFAHDSEKKWVQNHPVILYENCLIRHGIRIVQQYFEKNFKKPLFCYDVLTKEGAEYAANLKVSLFSDDDLRYFIKNVCGNSFSFELFDRKSRRHPLWKSEAEYFHLINKYIPPDSHGKLFDIFDRIEKYLQNTLEADIIPPIINKDSFTKIKEEYENANSELQRCTDKKINETLKAKCEMYKGISECFRIFKSFAKKMKIEFSFVVILTNRFKSNFSKIEIDKLRIWFKPSLSHSNIKNILAFLSTTLFPYIQDGDKPMGVFYFYYKRGEKGRLTQEQFFSKLCKELLEISF